MLADGAALGGAVVGAFDGLSGFFCSLAAALSAAFLAAFSAFLAAFLAAPAELGSGFYIGYKTKANCNVRNDIIAKNNCCKCTKIIIIIWNQSSDSGVKKFFKRRVTSDFR